MRWLLSDCARFPDGSFELVTALTILRDGLSSLLCMSIELLSLKVGI